MDEFAVKYLEQALLKTRSRGVEEEIWAKHYSSKHQILLVGEGDFSFALSLALTFGSASNIVASSLDSYDVVIKKYKRAKTNLELLAGLGARILHGVDATMMKLRTRRRVRKFDRIVFNFPHAGFLGNERDQQVIMMHKCLVHGFFKNASGMLRPNGEVHVTHKTAHPFHCWNIEELATQSCLALLEQVEFNLEDYPGYENKRGDGSRSDKPFPLGECSSFKFVSSSTSKKSTFSHHINHQEIPLQRANGSVVMNPAPVMNRSECFRIFSEYFDHARRMNGQAEISDKLRLGFERYKAENRGRPLNGYVNLLEDLRNLSKQRIVFLQNQLLEIDKQRGL